MLQIARRCSAARPVLSWDLSMGGAKRQQFCRTPSCGLRRFSIPSFAHRFCSWSALRPHNWEGLMKVNLCPERVARLAMAIAMTAAMAVAANAQTVLVDFGSNASFRGVSVPAPDLNGHYWNSLTPGPFFANLIDINNTPTTIDLGFDTPVGTDSFNGPAGATSFPSPTAAEIAATDIDAAALGNLGVKEAAIDFAASPGSGNNNTRFQIQGLDPSKSYTLTLFGSHKFSDNDATVYSVFSDATYTTSIASTSLNVQ